VALTPGDPEAQHNLGTVLLMQSKPEEAVACFPEALRFRQDSAGAHYHMALALVRQDKAKEALPHAQKARDLALAAD
jgi:tetratricopeptide (TPR) repeat protein